LRLYFFFILPLGPLIQTEEDKQQATATAIFKHHFGFSITHWFLLTFLFRRFVISLVLVLGGAFLELDGLILNSGALTRSLVASPSISTTICDYINKSSHSLAAGCYDF